MKRLAYIDTLKAFGMFLVYYGHLVEKIYQRGTESAFLHFQIIYSFHMPLFFLLAGIFWKKNNLSLFSFIKLKLTKRIIPVITFSSIVFPFIWIFSEKSEHLRLDNIIYKYICGYPFINSMMWFLVCLFTVELIIKLISSKLLLENKSEIIACIVAFIFFGWIASDFKGGIAHLTKIPINFWYINESMVAISFYLLGFLFKDFLLKKRNIKSDLILLFISGVIFIKTVSLNMGLENNPSVVLMSTSSHGNYLLFYVTALSGILFSVMLIRLVPINSKPINFVGNNTLIYLGLNGFNFRFIDRNILDIIPFNITNSGEVLVFCTLYTIVIMLLFSPLVWFLKNRIPELVGNNYANTSLIPPLDFYSLMLKKHWQSLKQLYTKQI